MPGIPNYRGLRRTPNRKALLDAAEELFGRNGFGAVSVDDIVARAGVAKGTFYNHFASKEDIAGKLALDIRFEVRDRISLIKPTSSDPAIHLAIAATLFLDLARTKPRRAWILANLLGEATDVQAAMNEPVRQTLAAGMAQGRFRSASPEVALVVVLGIVAAGIRHIVERPPPDPQAFSVTLTAHLLGALGLPNHEVQAILAAPVVAAIWAGA
jgi:AcrR family transcriptional regulator